MLLFWDELFTKVTGQPLMFQGPTKMLQVRHLHLPSSRNDGTTVLRLPFYILYSIL